MDAVAELAAEIVDRSYWQRPRLEWLRDQRGSGPWDSVAVGRWLSARADWGFEPNFRTRKSQQPTDQLYIVGFVNATQRMTWRHDHQVEANNGPYVGVDRTGTVLAVSGGDDDANHRRRDRPSLRTPRWCDRIVSPASLQLDHLKRIAWSVDPTGWGDDMQMRS